MSVPGLSEKDWDELVGVTAPAEDYVNPDIMPHINGKDAIQSDTELELNRDEFNSSPPVPVIGWVPRFGDMLLPTRLLASNPVRVDSDTVFSTRHTRRESASAVPTLPPFESIRDHIRPPTIPLPQLVTASKPSGKSARARLFGSPDESNKENQPTSIPPREPPPSHTRQSDPVSTKLTGRAAKKPLGTSRRSRDSAKTRPPALQLLQPDSKTARRFKRCSVPGCGKGARSKGLCKRHGGGKRCSIMACGNSAQSRGLCKSHGGGKQFGVSGCFRSSQGGGFCRDHGGGKICKARMCFLLRHTGDFCYAHAVIAAAAGTRKGTPAIPYSIP